MLLELFTGKSPTHETFTGGISLTKWVQSAFPTSIAQVLDPELLQLMKDLDCESQSTGEGKHDECLVNVIGLGLSCTVDSPDERISMRDALRKLKIAREALLKPNLIKKV